VRTSHAAWISSDEVTKLSSLLDWRYTTCIACYWRFSISYKKTYLILLLSSNLFSVVPQVAEWAKAKLMHNYFVQTNKLLLRSSY
jgi:hypothetical protein